MTTKVIPLSLPVNYHVAYHSPMAIYSSPPKPMNKHRPGKRSKSSRRRTSDSEQRENLRSAGIMANVRRYMAQGLSREAAMERVSENLVRSGRFSPSSARSRVYGDITGATPELAYTTGLTHGALSTATSAAEAKPASKSAKKKGAPSVSVPNPEGGAPFEFQLVPPIALPPPVMWSSGSAPLSTGGGNSSFHAPITPSNPNPRVGTGGFASNTPPLVEQPDGSLTPLRRLPPVQTIGGSPWNLLQMTG